MQDEADIIIDSDGEEIPVPRFFEAMEIHPRTRRIDLEVERRVLDRLLLVWGQSGEAIGKCVGDSEVHLIALVPWMTRLTPLGGRASVPLCYR